MAEQQKDESEIIKKEETEFSSIDKYLSDGYLKKYIIYLDDDGQTKKKVALIKQDNAGVSIKIGSSSPFWIPHTRVLKIKEVTQV